MRVFISFTVVLFSMLICTAADTPSPSHIDTAFLLAEAYSSLRGQDPYLASNNLLEVLKSSPGHQRSEFVEGLLTTVLQTPVMTITEPVPSTFPTANPRPLSNGTGVLEYTLGRIYEQMTDYRQAEMWYLVAALVQPGVVQFWQSATTLSFPISAINWTVSEAVLKMALTVHPQHPELRFHLDRMIQQRASYSGVGRNYEKISSGDNSELEIVAYMNRTMRNGGDGDDDGVFFGHLLKKYASVLHFFKAYQRDFGVLSSALTLQENGVLSSMMHRLVSLARSAVLRQLKSQAGFIEENSIDGRWLSTLRVLHTPIAEQDAVWWYFAAGMSLFLSGDYTTALASCRQAEHLLPPHLPSHLVHGCQGISNLYLYPVLSSDIYLEEATNQFSMANDLLADPDYQDHLPFLGFAMNKADIEINLMSTLGQRRDHGRCIALCLDLLGLPHQGGVTILVFSFVDWTPSLRVKEMVNDFGYHLVQKGELVLPIDETLFDEAQRVRMSNKGYLNAAYNCVIHSVDPVVTKAHTEASATIAAIVLSPLTASAKSLRHSEPYNERDAVRRQCEDETSNGFVLITQFYFPDDLNARRNVQDVLIRNLGNEAIGEIYLICEQEYNFDQLPNAYKITKFILPTRLKFSEALQLANDRLSGRSVILSNSDIYFDASLEDLTAKLPLPLPSRLMLALSTWAPQPSDNSESISSLTLSLRSDSQDAWLFTAPVPEAIIAQTDFFFGVPRCDNRLAKVFLDSGYSVKNPAFLVHAVEVDTQLRAHPLYSKAGEVLGDVANVAVCDNDWLDMSK